MNEDEIAWIKSTRLEEAGSDLEALYQNVLDPVSGGLDNIMRIHSLNPAGLKAHFDLYRAVMSATPSLRGAEREMIALVVSKLNDCHY